jgi:hypothetical protein
MVKVEVIEDRKVPVVSFPTMWDRGITRKELILTYPNDLAQVVQLTTEVLSAHLLLMAALKMFELGKLSSGKAAELTGLSRAWSFSRRAADTGFLSSITRTMRSKPSFALMSRNSH